MYPGYFGRQDLNADNLSAHVAQMLAALVPKLEHEMEHCLCYGREREAVPAGNSANARRARTSWRRFSCGGCRRSAALLIRDVQAAFDGDPAALNLDEIILAYPGVLAVSVYRIAHALYDLGVPMMARIMTEWAHSKTGCDIHPGATIGAAFFIDHATGVVIGETTHIGEGVKIYQGVTLGALSLPRDASGQIIRGKKRHPTVERRFDAVCQCHRARRPDRGGRRQRHRRLGVPDAQRAAAFARIAQGAGTARGARATAPRSPTRFTSISRACPGATAPNLRGRGDRAIVKRGSAAYIILPSTGTSSSATMLMILISGLIAGPAVSL